MSDRDKSLGGTREEQREASSGRPSLSEILVEGTRAREEAGISWSPSAWYCDQEAARRRFRF